MRALVQRVQAANVQIADEIYAAIKSGMLILLGVEIDDNQEDIDWLCCKLTTLRIFDDPNGVMNCDAISLKKEFLVVSQFTLMASTKKGSRPSYIAAARPEIAAPLYHQFVQTLQQYTDKEVKTGLFGANMQIQLVNDGPVTIFIDSKRKE